MNIRKGSCKCSKELLFNCFYLPAVSSITVLEKSRIRFLIRETERETVV